MVRFRKVLENDPPFTTKSCDKCDELDSVEMVLCDTCSQHTHFKCASIDKATAPLLKSWLCSACFSLGKKPKTQRSAENSPSLQSNKQSTSNQSTPVLSTSKSNVSASTPAPQSSTLSTMKSVLNTPLSEDKKKLSQLKTQLSQAKREHSQDLEREKTKTARAEQNASEALIIGENLQKELEELKVLQAKSVEESDLRVQQAKQEAEKFRVLYTDMQAQLIEMQKKMEDLSQPECRHAETQAAIDVPQSQSVSRDAAAHDRTEQVQRSLEDRLQALREGLSAKSVHNLRVNIPPVNVEADNAIVENIAVKVGSVISDLIKGMVPGQSAPPLQQPRTAETILQPLIDLTQKVPSSAPAMSRSDSLRNLGCFNGAEGFMSPREEPSDVARLVSNMGRGYLTKLPDYHGDVKEWPYFESVYETTTQQGGYSDLDNVHRLRQVLKGRAYQRVQGLLLTSRSGNAIMQTLRASFGRSDLLLSVMTTDLLKFPKMSSKIDGKLMDLSTSLCNFVSTMQKQNMHSELQNMFLVSQLELKLDFDHQREWKAKKNVNIMSGVRNDVVSFSEFVAARAAEMPLESFGGQNHGRSDQDRKLKRVNTHQKASDQKAGDSGSIPAAKGCFKCNGFHAMATCTEFLKLTPQERSKFVYDNRICYACIKFKSHRGADCKFKKECGVGGCKYFHHQLLHFAKSRKEAGQRQSNSQVDQGTVTPVSASASSNRSSLSVQAPAFAPDNTVQHQAHSDKSNTNSVLFKILPVRIHGASSFVDTYAFLDDGSSLTLMDKEVFEDLGLDGESEQLHLQWTKGITRTEEAWRTSVRISGRKSKTQHVLTNVYCVEQLDLPAQSVNAEAMKKTYRHLRGLPIPDFQEGKPKILIGLQHSKFLLGTNNHTAGENDPIASKTQLGWTVFGSTAQTMGVVALNNHKNSGIQLTIREATRDDEELHRLVKGFFTTENFGVMPPVRDLVSAENERATRIMKETLKKVGDRYEIGLLWKADGLTLPDSYPMAMRRLVGLERTLKRKPELLKWKNNHVRELVNKGYARKATPDELKQNWPRIWYCPTFVVVNANKVPPKPRDVADVAATVQGQSLNSNLLKGPDNMAPLFSGLFRFRENAVAVNADVKEMFHQIKIIEQDQQCQRFLYRDCDDSRTPDVYVMQRMMFGPTCSPSCAQFVKNTHAALFEKEMPEASSALIKYTYVDDYFNSHATVEEALRVTRDAFTICETMGFDLVGVQSNSLNFLEQTPENKVKTSLVSINANDSESYMAKVLGMCWQSFPDYFTYKVCRDELVEKMLSDTFVPTKREILRTLMRTFDPLGLLAQYLIRGKIVLQEVWREGTGWDDPIPQVLLPRWQEFIHELLNIDQLKIPRRYASVVPAQSDVSLIVFVDASEQAFAATAYFRFEDSSTVDVAHVMAKSKVAPIKRLTIPQLELQAAVLGVRLAKTIKDLHAFPIESTKFLSDSKVVLAWICSRKYNFKTFVAARIGEILETSNRREWFHVSSKDNVADDATKWTDPRMGDVNTRWFRGPDFLQSSPASWPLKPAVDCEENEEIVAQTHMMIHHYQSGSLPKYKFIDEISSRFRARWSSLVRVVAYMNRFLDAVTRKGVPSEKHITPSEICRAEEVIFRKIQSEAFSNEVQALKAGEDTVSNSSKLLKFCPFMKSGVIRMNSRAQKANISYAAKCPVILPNKHPLVDLLILHYHEKNFHMGTEMTIADVRQVAWVINIGTAMKRVARACQLCKVFKATPSAPLMGELPVARVDFGVKPFTHVGLDAFGPYQVTYRRGSVKRYGLIFTCLTYRAVHLEVLNDMSTDACIMAIQRFLARRGWSSHFYSDNGKNFVGAKNVLHEELEMLRESLGEACSKTLGIHWHLQPAYSPWWGGAWERLIQSIKKCVDFLMKEENPREDIFLNAITQAEFWMNRRPLTHTPLSSEDAQPLTPNTVLYGDDHDKVASVIGLYDVNDRLSRKAYRRVQHLVNKFLTRWTKEYLPLINRRSKWYERKNPVKLDDIVILTDPSEPKTAWKKGRVIKLYPGTDGVVRAVDVQLADKTIKRSRAVGRIAVLDVESSHAGTGVQTVPGMSSADEEVQQNY